MKAALGEISALAYIFVRFALVIGLMFAWLSLRGELHRPRQADVPLFLLAGISGYAGSNALFTVGLSYTSAFSAAVLVSAGPIFTLLLASLLRVETIRTRQWVGIACSVVGVGVFVSDRLQGMVPAAGDLITLLGAAAFAVYGLATQPLARRYGAPLVIAWSALIGMIAIAPVALPATLREDWGRVGLGAWASLVYSSAMSMLVAYTLWAWAIERRGIARTTPYLYLVPIITGACAALFLGETFGVLKVVGAALVLGGLAIIRHATARSDREETTAHDRTAPEASRSVTP
jgi:drug/metabolite transporter (DMT)-like permease